MSIYDICIVATSTGGTDDTNYEWHHLLQCHRGDSQRDILTSNINIVLEGFIYDDKTTTLEIDLIAVLRVIEAMYSVLTSTYLSNGYSFDPVGTEKVI